MVILCFCTRSESIPEWMYYPNAVVMMGSIRKHALSVAYCDSHANSNEDFVPVEKFMQISWKNATVVNMISIGSDLSTPYNPFTIWAQSRFRRTGLLSSLHNDCRIIIRCYYIDPFGVKNSCFILPTPYVLAKWKLHTYSPRNHLYQVRTSIRFQIWLISQD